MKATSTSSWSRDSKRIVIGCRDSTARVWDVEGAGEPLLLLQGHVGAVTSAAWSRPDGARILTDDGHTVRVWNADGTGQPRVLRGPDDAATSAAWSPDGTRILTHDGDMVRVWSASEAGHNIALDRLSIGDLQEHLRKSADDHCAGHAPHLP